MTRRKDETTVSVSGINLAWDAARGVCTFEGLPVAMLWIDSTLAGLMAGVQAMVGPERFALALQAEGRLSIAADWEVIAACSDFSAGFAAIADIAAVAGWGEWRLLSLDATERVCRYRVTDGWEGRYQKSLGVCWGSGMLAGKLAGYTSRHFATNCWAEQTSFIARGDPFDEFEVRPSSRTVEDEIEQLLRADEATSADMAVALQDLRREVAERARAEESLRERTEQQRAILRTAMDGVWIADLQGRLLEVNEAYCRMTGYTEDELLAMSIRDLEVVESGVDVVAHIDDIKASGQDRFETRHRRKDGRIIDVEVSTKYRTAQGGTMVAFLRDITDGKRSAEATRAGEEKYHGIFDDSVAAIYAFDAHKKFTDANQAGLDLLGYRRDELLSLSTSDVDADPVVVLPAHQDLLAGGKLINYEHQLRRRDGAVITVLNNSRPLTDADGQVVGMLSTLIDITERKRAEIQRVSLEEQLRQAQRMESIGRLAGGVAHDFNNMLGVIIGHAELAMLLPKLPEELRPHLEGIRKAADRSAELTRQLLVFARRQPLEPEIVDLGASTTDLLGILRRLVGENIAITLHTTPDLWPVRSDRSQMDQVLTNLCVNARDAIADVGTITITLDNCAMDAQTCAGQPDATPGDYVRLSVSDDGCGMDQTTVSQVFEPFFTTKERGRGTGLGLATVYGAVRQNNGFVTVDSEPGRGSTFAIHLPRHRGAAAAAPKHESAPASAPSGRTILLVEDESDLIALLTESLTRSGFRVLAAQTPNEAIRIASAGGAAIDLVVTDLIMPQMNGRELVTRLDALVPGLRHLYMSGYTANIIGDHGLLGAGEPFLQKPFAFEALLAKVNALLSA